GIVRAQDPRRRRRERPGRARLPARRVRACLGSRAATAAARILAHLCRRRAMRWVLIGAGVVVLALVGAGIAYYLHVKHAGRDVKGSSTVEFVTTQAAPPPPPPPGIAWPTYGHDQERRRFANGISLAPPFQQAWMFRARSLLEFPPA